MSKLTEAELRDAKEDLLSRGVQQAVGLPSQRAAEDWIDPILRKVEVDADSPQPFTPDYEPEAERELGPGEDYGQPGHGPRVPEARHEHEEVVLKSQVLGEVGITKGGLKVPEQLKRMAAKPQYPPHIRASLHCVREMYALGGEWKRELEDITYNRGRFLTARKSEKDEALKLLLERYLKEYGDPRVRSRKQQRALERAARVGQ